MKIKSILLIVSSIVLLSSFPLIVFAETTSNHIDDINFDEDDTTVSTTFTTETTTEETTTRFSGFGFGSGFGNGNTTTTTNGGSDNETTGNSPTQTTETTESDTLVTEETSTAHEHDYQIIDFSGETGVATIRCSGCGDTYSDTFVNHLFNDTHQTLQPDDEPWDVVPDGTINAKDYAWLFKHYYSYYNFIAEFLNSKSFLYKEMFLYIYITILFLFSTFIICILLWRIKQ